MLNGIKYIDVINNGSTAVPGFGIMSQYGVDASGYALVREATADNETKNLLINGPTAIAVGFPGQGHSAFPAMIAYNGQTDAGTAKPAVGEHWGVASGSWLLTKCKTGFSIIGGGGNGITNAEPVFLGKLRGKMDADLTFGSSAAMSVWEYSGGDADTGCSLTVYDWLLQSGQTIFANCKVTAFFDVFSGRVYVDGAECPCTTTTTTTTTTSTTTTTTTSTSTTAPATTTTTTTTTSTSTTTTSTTSTTSTSTSTTTTTTTSTTTTTQPPCEICQDAFPVLSSVYRCISNVWVLQSNCCANNPGSAGCPTCDSTNEGDCCDVICIT